MEGSQFFWGQTFRKKPLNDVANSSPLACNDAHVRLWVAGPGLFARWGWREQSMAPMSCLRMADSEPSNIALPHQIFQSSNNYIYIIIAIQLSNNYPVIIAHNHPEFSNSRPVGPGRAAAGCEAFPSGGGFGGRIHCHWCFETAFWKMFDDDVWWWCLIVYNDDSIWWYFDSLWW